MAINTVNQIISPEEEAQILQSIDAARTLLTCLTELSNAELKHLPRGNKSSLDFIVKVSGHAQNRPEFLPSYIDLTDFMDSVALNNSLQVIFSAVKELHGALMETETVLISQAYQVARLYYKSIKDAAKASIPGAKKIRDDLKSHFKLTGSKNGNETPADEVPPQESKAAATTNVKAPALEAG
ncbi:MAG: hypothetical protein GY765_11750 [bacterium]|nr:hypothetical protein [bacterium]